MLMAMFMKVYGWMIKLMEKESIYISMGLNMKDNGLKINSMDMGLKNGPMVLRIPANMRWVKSTVKGILYGISYIII